MKRLLTNILSSKAFTVSISILILLSVLAFMVGTIEGLPLYGILILNVLEKVFLIVFTAEYFIRIYTAESKLKYVFSFYGIIDLLSIIPFYFGLTGNLQQLRLFRFFQIFRILKLTRFNQAIDTLAESLKSVKGELLIFFFIVGIILLISGTGIYLFENPAQPEVFKNAFDGVWWAITTLTTVGYGDMYPITIGGKVFTFIVLMSGLGVVAIPTAMIAASVSLLIKRSKDVKGNEE